MIVGFFEGIKIEFSFLCIVFIKGWIYWMTTAHPIVRFPVFLMGVLGGLQVLRAHKNGHSFKDPNLSKNLFHSILPWGCGTSKCCRKCVCCRRNKEKDSESAIGITEDCPRKIWRKRTDFSAFVYVGFLSTLIVTKIVLDVKHNAKGK